MVLTNKLWLCMQYDGKPILGGIMQIMLLKQIERQMGGRNHEWLHTMRNVNLSILMLWRIC